MLKAYFKTFKGSCINITMIYLYKKTHNQTGMQYLGHTTAKDPYKYQGSGKEWIKHIAINDYDVTTEILKKCTTQKDMHHWEHYYSDKWNIVNSDQWANILTEGGPGRPSTPANGKRPICRLCNQKHVGINYIKRGKTYYRSKCDSCIRQSKKINPAKPTWSRNGYKKKMICDKCHFSARWIKQIIVYYIDGNLNNPKLNNLRSICLNCTITVEKQDMPWAKDLEIGPDN